MTEKPYTSATQVADSRKCFHGKLSPAIYSRHAREALVPDIHELSFPRQPELNPLKLAIGVGEKLRLTDDTRIELAQENGVAAATMGRFNVYKYGYGDRHFALLFAGGIGLDIGKLVQEDKKLINDPLSLMDYGKMFQTGWFGSLANQMALTTQGILQRSLEVDTFYPGSSLLDSINKGIRPNRRNELCIVDLYELNQDPDSGLTIVRLTKPTIKAFDR